MARPTIKHLAKAANVSVSTVNRVLGGHQAVRKATIESVLEAAEKIGFYGLGSIEGRLAASRRRYKFAILLQQSGRSFYHAMSDTLTAAAQATQDADIRLRVEFLKDLSPEHVATRMLALGSESDAIAVVSAEHPLITQAIETLADDGVPTFALISQLTARGGVNYVGLDNWKVGRTAAWAFARLCRQPAKIGILVGNHRYRCQELNESGFRSYCREYATQLQLLEPVLTYESSTIAREVTEQLLHAHPDIAGLYISGGGVTGALAAIRSVKRDPPLLSVGHEIMAPTRAALLDGTLTLVIAHQLDRMAAETLTAMRAAVDNGEGFGTVNLIHPFELYTSENL